MVIPIVFNELGTVQISRKRELRNLISEEGSNASRPK